MSSQALKQEQVTQNPAPLVATLCPDWPGFLPILDDVADRLGLTTIGITSTITVVGTESNAIDLTTGNFFLT